MGEAKLIEPYYYRHSNFQNWFTCDKTDPFVYVGCHYVDLVYFITGLQAGGGFRVRRARASSPTATRAICGPTAACATRTARCCP